MEVQERRFVVRFHICGGGLCLKQGQVVGESQLSKYLPWLIGQGAIEEVAEGCKVADEREPGRRMA